MLEEPKYEKQYQKVMGMERSRYWRDKAVDLNAENIELKIQAMAAARRAKLHAIWVTVGATLLLVALCMS